MISRLKRMSRGGWITIGIVLGAIIAPGVAIAAFSDIRIVGLSGSPAAQVTPTNQLQTTEIGAEHIRNFHLFGVRGRGTGQGECHSIAAPQGRSLMLKQAVFDVFVNSHSSVGDRVSLFTNPTCDKEFVVATHSPPGTGTFAISFEPGHPIKSGGSFSVQALGADFVAEVNVSGYTMPQNAVPATRP